MKIGFIAGAFDFLHAGHVHLLKQCKQNCDTLIVGLHIDPSVENSLKNRPVESVLERQIKLNGCRYVDGVVVYEKESDLSMIFNYFKIDVRFLGSDYKNRLGIGAKPITNEDAVPIQYIDSLPIHSSDIRGR